MRNEHGTNLVAVNQAERLLNLHLASSHLEKIMVRRVIALARLGEMEEANDAFDKFEE